MDKTPNGQKCKDCTNYLPHYIKSRGQFCSTLTGHCINKKPSGHFRHTDKICDCFEQRDLSQEKEEQTKSAVEWLGFIAKRVSELTQIFNQINEDKNTTEK